MTGAERIKRQKIKSKVRGQQRVSLHRALQITIGTLAFSLKKGGGGAWGAWNVLSRGEVIWVLTGSFWLLCMSGKQRSKGRTRVMSQASSGMVCPGSWW